MKTRAKTKSEVLYYASREARTMRLQSFTLPPSPAFTHLIVVAETPFITGVESGGEDGRESESGGEEREKSEVLSNCELIRV